MSFVLNFIMEIAVVIISEIVLNYISNNIDIVIIIIYSM